jgi:hypothetical protein
MHNGSKPTLTAVVEFYHDRSVPTRPMAGLLLDVPLFLGRVTRKSPCSSRC